MSAQLQNECTAPMMEEPGLVRHVTELDRKLTAAGLPEVSVLTPERISHYLERGSRLRSEWWIGKIKAVGRGIGWLLGRSGSSRPDPVAGAGLRVVVGGCASIEKGENL